MTHFCMVHKLRMISVLRFIYKKDEYATETICPADLKVLIIWSLIEIVLTPIKASTTDAAYILTKKSTGDPNQVQQQNWCDCVF